MLKRDPLENGEFTGTELGHGGLEPLEVVTQPKLRKRESELVVVGRDETPEAEIVLKEAWKTILPAADASDEVVAFHAVYGGRAKIGGADIEDDQAVIADEKAEHLAATPIVCQG